MKLLGRIYNWHKIVETFFTCNFSKLLLCPLLSQFTNIISSRWPMMSICYICTVNSFEFFFYKLIIFCVNLPDLMFYAIVWLNTMIWFLLFYNIIDFFINAIIFFVISKEDWTYISCLSISHFSSVFFLSKKGFFMLFYQILLVILDRASSHNTILSFITPFKRLRIYVESWRRIFLQPSILKEAFKIWLSCLINLIRIRIYIIA